MQRIVTIFCILLFGLYTIYWYWAAAGLKSAVNEEFARWQEAGYFTRASELRTEGYPWRLGLELSDFSVRSVADNQEIKLFDAEYVSLSGNLIGPIEYFEQGSFDQGFDLASLQEVKIFVGNLKLSENLIGPLPPVIEGVDVSLKAKGLLALTGTQAQKITKWRDTGGQIDFNSINMIWGDVAVDAKGKLLLDQYDQLSGSFSTTTAGMPKLLKTLGEQNIIDPDVASIAAAGAKFFAVPVKNDKEGSGEESRNAITLPVSFREGGVWLGPIQLTHIGPLTK